MHPDGALLARVFLPGQPVQRSCLEWRGGRVSCLRPLASGDSPSSPSSTVRSLADEALVVPAFHDGHTHVFGVGTSRLRPHLGEASNQAEALDLLRDWLARSSGTGPIIAEGWDESNWTDPTPPNLSQLDRITHRPLALRRECGHVAVFNSAALRELGTDWPDLDVDTGMAKETLPLSIPRLWPPSVEERRSAVELGQRECLSRGVVAIHEMGDPLTYDAFRSLESKGGLRLRVSHFFHSDHLETVLAESWEGTDHLDPAGMKFFLDGSFGGRSAWLRDPYSSGGSRPNGISIWEDEALVSAVGRCFAAGKPVAAHAIGDAAIDQALRCVETLGNESVAPPGFRIEHAEYLTPDLVARVESLPVLLSMQPNFVARWQAAGGLYETVLGAERSSFLNPLRTACRLDGTFFGSDCMPLDPLLGLSGATNHPIAAQRLSPGEALEAYTARPARSVARPLASGRLEEGEPADFVVLERMEREDTPDNEDGPDFCLDWRVLETWIAGECVYSAAEVQS